MGISIASRDGRLLEKGYWSVKAGKADIHQNDLGTGSERSQQYKCYNSVTSNE